MVSPARIDAIIDLAYGALIAVAIVLIATREFGIGIAFGVGVFSAYVLHVVWKMARFDPDWMTTVVQETVEETVGDTVEDKMEEAVGKTVEQSVEATVGETVDDRLDTVQAQVEAVDERVDRRPREDQVEELIEESVTEESPADHRDE